MKKFFAILIALFLSLMGFAQSCLPDGILFSTQSQIDSFQVNYPKCKEIEGSVTIYGSDPYEITNLSGLSVLTSLGGDIILKETNGLTSLMGLDGLTSIGGDLTIYNNYALTSLTGLSELNFIGGDLWLVLNAHLTNLTGLNKVTSIGDWLYICGNDALNSLTGLEGLTSTVKNPILSICNVKSVCDYLVSPNGTVVVNDNGIGCDSKDEVIEACTFGVDD